MKSFRTFALCFAVLLSGCVSAGIATQAQSETTYSLAATAALIYLQTGHPNADAVKVTCSGDVASYGVLISTRTPVDGASYAASDNAHAALQAECSTLTPHS